MEKENEQIEAEAGIVLEVKDWAGIGTDESSGFNKCEGQTNGSGNAA